MSDTMKRNKINNVSNNADLYKIEPTIKSKTSGHKTSRMSEQVRLDFRSWAMYKILCVTMKTCISACSRTEIIYYLMHILDLCIYFTVKPQVAR